MMFYERGNLLIAALAQHGSRCKIVIVKNAHHVMDQTGFFDEIQVQLSDLGFI